MSARDRGEAVLIAGNAGLPAMRSTLAADLRALGISDGTTVLVHSSLSVLGWVVGGSEAVVLALEDAVGESGTQMTPALSLNAPEPSRGNNPPVPESRWSSIRENVPAFDPDLSPTRAIGVVP